MLVKAKAVGMTILAVLVLSIVFYSTLLFLGFMGILKGRSIDLVKLLQEFFQQLQEAWNNFVKSLQDAWNWLMQQLQGGGG